MKLLKRLTNLIHDALLIKSLGLSLFGKTGQLDSLGDDVIEKVATSIHSETIKKYCKNILSIRRTDRYN